MEKKDITDRDKLRLRDAANQLARISSNCVCVDCRQPGCPWISVNLGVFLCFRCSGIHRGMGVHISQVRSINLDTLTPSNLAALIVNGNLYVNSWLMSKGNAPRPRVENDEMMRDYIVEKYVRHRFGTLDGVLLVNKDTFPGLTVDKVLELHKLALHYVNHRADHVKARLDLIRAAGYHDLASIPQSTPLNQQLILQPGDSSRITATSPTVAAVAPVPRPVQVSVPVAVPMPQVEMPSMSQPTVTAVREARFVDLDF